MLWDGESSDFEFADDEALYFRVQPENFFKHQGQLRINSAAIQLPDKSVNRSKGGGRAEFARHNAYPGCNGMCNGRHHSWTVARIEAKDVCVGLHHQPEDVFFHTKPVHDPLKYNRFHTEIRAFDSQEQHIDPKHLEKLGRNAHLRWSRRVARYAQVVIAGDMRQD
ncbi:MAG: hypothetical protein KJ052_03890 [Candidatus Hydrogenedentes bacterium]|nr:hypothetical protein [Candidatus Hydrogenedentota bacterium]